MNAFTMIVGKLFYHFLKDVLNVLCSIVCLCVVYVVAVTLSSGRCDLAQLIAPSITASSFLASRGSNNAQASDQHLPQLKLLLYGGDKGNQELPDTQTFGGWIANSVGHNETRKMGSLYGLLLAAGRLWKNTGSSKQRNSA